MSEMYWEPLPEMIRRRVDATCLKYQIHLTPGKDHREIREWCNENIGDCHLLWSADLPGCAYSFHNKKDAVLFALKWL